MENDKRATDKDRIIYDNNEIVLAGELLDKAVKGSEEARNKVANSCYGMLKKMLGKDYDSFNDSVQEVMLLVSKDNFKLLKEYLDKAEDKDFKFKMLYSIMQRLFMRVENNERARKFQITGSAHHYLSLITRASEMFNIPMCEENAWLFSEITGIGTIQVVKVLRDRGTLKVHDISFSLIENKYYKDEENEDADDWN